MVTYDLETIGAQLIIIFGASLGNFIATLPPFWKEKFRFAEFDIKIFFDTKFLGTALVTGFTSVIVVTALYSTIETQIGDDATILMAFLSAVVIGLSLNVGLNKIVGSPNVKQKEELAEAEKQEIIEEYEAEKKLTTTSTKAKK